jgi:hypothetical protein
MGDLAGQVVDTLRSAPSSTKSRSALALSITTTQGLRSKQVRTTSVIIGPSGSPSRPPSSIRRSPRLMNSTRSSNAVASKNSNPSR